MPKNETTDIWDCQITFNKEVIYPEELLNIDSFTMDVQYLQNIRMLRISLGLHSW